MHFTKRLFIAIITLLSLTSIPLRNTYAQESGFSEAKAYWINTIIEWVDWRTRPKNKKTIICTIGRDKVYTYLNKIKRNNKDNNFIAINKAPNDDFSECYILYVSDSEQEYYTNILDRANGQHGIVTISSIKGFARRGGIIEFVIKKKAHPIINLKSAAQSRIVIDSELRGWATTIR